MTPRRGCRFGRHLWTVEEEGIFCLYCGKRRRHRRTLFCLVGLHNWTHRRVEQADYLVCRNCGKYGGDPGGPSFAIWVRKRDDY